MSADIQPYDPGLPDLHPDPAQWSHEDFVAAWQANDNRSAWNRAFLAAAYQGAHGDLQRYADAVGVGYQTLVNYRAVVKAYAKSTDVGRFPFGVADALRGQEDRLELVQREQPWSVEEARLLVQARRGPRPPKVVQAKAEPVTAAHDSGPGGPNGPVPTEEVGKETSAGAAGTVEPGVTNATVKPSAKSDSAPCSRCADLQAKLEKAHAEIERLSRIRPDTVMAAELEAVTADRDRLQQENAELRRSAPPGAPELVTPAVAPPEETGAADSAHGKPQAPPGPGARGLCGSVHASKVHITLPDDREAEKWFCRKHAELVADSGAEVSAAPVSEWDVGTCQYPVRAEVAA